MRQVQVRGCLPAILLLAVLGVLTGLVITASLAVLLPVAGALLVLGLARALWYRLTGRTPPPLSPVTFPTVRIDPGWVGGSGPRPAGGDGPVVDALPRPSRGGAPGDGEAGAAEPGRLPGPPGPGGPVR